MTILSLLGTSVSFHFMSLVFRRFAIFLAKVSVQSKPKTVTAHTEDMHNIVKREYEITEKTQFSGPILADVLRPSAVVSVVFYSCLPSSSLISQP